MGKWASASFWKAGSGGTLQDISAPLFLNDYRLQAVAPEVIAENNRSLEHQLASLRFFDISHKCPTNAGILLFGRDVRHWLPGAYVQWLSYDGLTPAANVTNAIEIFGDLPRVLRELDALIKAELRRFPVAESVLQERMVEVYPRVAVRELVMNAIMHRDYASTAPCRITFFSDRLEIQSPGGLYGEASPQNFPQKTSYRNPVITEAMKVLGYVNR